ncbi:MAG: ABC transporter substrate-binding protein [Thermobacillus sp.]|uniref:ABC-type sugar transport system, periplasmic component n=1 Tax=Thermobacillus composti (strain DSM 18247 / JCM 13945 / KWC4) TaxID=717605 RepID=L0EI81_THECK|nr:MULTISPECIES: extracellular solute-binding protein [Thermobacillus]AGA59396.1 ABC-type sugar transport system, periplasmic component [Thermobacillus composti KWC4]REK58416.1 MAG: ABC transporter substrate-binding protein [Thermobacillus sp.]
MTIRKRLLPLLAVLSLLAGLLAGCGGGSGGKGGDDGAGGNSGGSSGEVSGGSGELKGEFVLWTWEPEHPIALEAFYRKYPGIKLKRVEVAAEDVPKKLQTTIASGGELPDVIRIERGQKAKIFDMDILQNLEAVPFNADLSVLFEYDIAAFSMNGHMVAIPDDMSVSGIAYIKELAREHFGTDNPEEMEKLLPDWNTFIAKGQEVVQKSGGKVLMFPSLGGVWDILKGQRSEPFFDGDTMNTDVVRERVALLVKFRDSGIVGKLDQWTPAWNASFATSDYMFAVSPVWMPQYVIGPNDPADDRWALMVAPGGGFIRGGSSHGIPKGAKNAELAWKWIEFTSMSQEGAEAQKTDGVYTHYKPAYEDPEFTKWNWRNFGNQDIGKKFFVDISNVTTDVPENLNDSLLDEAMAIIIQTLAKDSSFGLEDAMARIEQELKAKNANIVIN